MNLSNEDNLRMNVLLHQDLQAIRIDESKMIVYGLSDKGEAKVDLKPNWEVRSKGFSNPLQNFHEV